MQQHWKHHIVTYTLSTQKNKIAEYECKDTNTTNIETYNLFTQEMNSSEPHDGCKNINTADIATYKLLAQRIQ